MNQQEGDNSGTYPRLDVGSLHLRYRDVLLELRDIWGYATRTTWPPSSLLSLLDGKIIPTTDSISGKMDVNTPQKCTSRVLLGGKSICNFDRMPCTCTSDKDHVPKEGSIRELLIDKNSSLHYEVTMVREDLVGGRETYDLFMKIKEKFAVRARELEEWIQMAREDLAGLKYS
jgi:hypothetical protein